MSSPTNQAPHIIQNIAIMDNDSEIGSPTHLVPHNLENAFESHDHPTPIVPRNLLSDFETNEDPISAVLNLPENSSHVLPRSALLTHDVVVFEDGPATNQPLTLVFQTPNGTRLWTPNVALEDKPVVGRSFDSLDDAYTLYASYAEQAGFSVRKNQAKVWNGVVTHKYFQCNKAGKPQMKRTFDSFVDDTLKARQTTFTLTDCDAHICVILCKEKGCYVVQKFVENHNHPLVDTYNRDLTKSGRKLSFAAKQFIHQMSLNKIGPVRAHSCYVTMKGGHHNVHGTPVDFKNFCQKMRIFIGERDSQLVLDRLRDRFDSLPEFFYDFVVQNGQLTSIFWADEISKLNYKVFGDVVAFDATYQTNKYNMIFVPFTGVDYNKQCVTFGAGLIFSETIDSYKWLLQSFLKAHEKQPALVLTDQDPAMRQAILQVFTESHHRLCMWHIMKKLPVKMTGELLQNTNFRQCIHRLVWNVYIKPSTFESRWQELLANFGLEDHSWLKEMYDIRDRWVPAYFREIPMCCLMKTTSRCESSNASFKVNSTSANTLVQFMLCYETRIDAQRYRQRMAEYKTSTTQFPDTTGLTIERHAFELYTHPIFMEVLKEIAKGKESCYVSNTKTVDELLVFSVTHLDRMNGYVNVFEVKFNPLDSSAECSCRGFIHIGYLCRHVFCVYRVKNVQKIPAMYVTDRWLRDALPKRVFSIENRYGVDHSPQAVWRNQILELVTECVDVVRTDTDLLSKLVQRLKDIKINLVDHRSIEAPVIESNEAVVEELVGQPMDVEISCSNPEVVRTKGCGRNRRLKSVIAETKAAKPPKAPRLCRTCMQYVINHDSRNCKKMSNGGANASGGSSQTQTPSAAT